MICVNYYPPLPARHSMNTTYLVYQSIDITQNIQEQDQSSKSTLSASYFNKSSKDGTPCIKTYQCFGSYNLHTPARMTIQHTPYCLYPGIQKRECGSFSFKDNRFIEAIIVNKESKLNQVSALLYKFHKYIYNSKLPIGNQLASRGNFIYHQIFKDQLMRSTMKRDHHQSHPIENRAILFLLAMIIRMTGRRRPFDIFTTMAHC